MADAAVVDPKTVNPETHDPETGKSWKELAKEHARKAQEAQDALRRDGKDQPDGAPANGAGPVAGFRTKEEYVEYLRGRMEDDLVGTVIEIATTATRVGIRETRQEMAQGAKLLKQVKRELREKYAEDFAQHEEEFDARLEDQPLGRMSKEGLLMIFHAIRGEGLEAKLTAERDKAAKAAAEAPRKIVGPTSPSAGGTPPAPSGEKPLTKEQQAELAKMGDVTEAGYRRLIKQKQERAKKLGIPEAQWPQTIGEPIRRPESR